LHCTGWKEYGVKVGYNAIRIEYYYSNASPPTLENYVIVVVVFMVYQLHAGTKVHFDARISH